MIGVIVKIVSLLSRRERLQVLGLLAFMALAAMLESLGIASIIPVIGTLFQGGGTPPKLVRVFTDLIPVGTNRELLLVWVIGGFAVIQMVKNIIIFVNGLAINRFIQANIARNVQHVFARTLARPYLEMTRLNSAVVIRDVFNTTAQAFDCLRVMLQLVLEGMLVLVATLVLLLVEPVLSLTTAAAFGLLGGLYYLFMGHRVRRWGHAKHEHEGRIFQIVRESIASIKDIKIHNCQPFMVSQLGRHIVSWAHVTGYGMTVIQLARLFVETMVVFGILGIVVFTLSHGDSMASALSTLGLFSMAALRMMPSMNRILTSATLLKERTAVVEKLHASLTRPLQPTPSGPPPSLLGLERSVALEGVWFAYGADGPPVLADVGFSLAAGQSLGIVGPSGSGKTTLMDITLGLLSPDRGRLLVDGRNVLAPDLLASWQASIGYVSQSLAILDDTLRRNIAFGIADREIDDAAVRRALDMASLGGVVAALPDGLDTRMGESGIRVSGGQRQRIGIARALYRNPAVLMFDEATSALDNETEREVTAAIEGLRGSKTMIIIAHRLSTVRNCTTLLFMRGGRMVDCGPYDELMERSADFRAFSAGGDAQPT